MILELEREQNDLLIIAHESVLRVLYGYLMACNAADIPFLEFPRDEIIEVRTSHSSDCFDELCELNYIRSFPRATRMKHAESILLTCQKRLSPGRLKI